MDTITAASLQRFASHLCQNEKSRATVAKYLHAVGELARFLGGDVLTKSRLLEHRDSLQQTCRASTVNGRLSAINAYLDFCGLSAHKVRLLKVQPRAFLDEARELSETEYKRLLGAARSRGNERLYLLMLTLCSTGIRVGELPFITVEAMRAGRADIRLKGKSRTILLPKELCGKLRRYVQSRGIGRGPVFCTRSGQPLDAANICHDMKKLCEQAGVRQEKVFPHNLRHLFARSFYAVEKNLAHLADILGHSRIETTRIYVAASASTHERVLRKMKLII
jgi:integrase-like protein intD